MLQTNAFGKAKGIFNMPLTQKCTNMLRLGNKFSCSLTKSMAANTAATASKEAAQSGKTVMADTSCHKLSKRDLDYFSSEKFAKTLTLIEDRELAKAYGKLIASRKRETNLSRAWE